MEVQIGTEHEADFQGAVNTTVYFLRLVITFDNSPIYTCKKVIMYINPKCLFLKRGLKKNVICL